MENNNLFSIKSFLEKNKVDNPKKFKGVPKDISDKFVSGLESEIIIFREYSKNNHPLLNDYYRDCETQYILDEKYLENSRLYSLFQDEDTELTFYKKDTENRILYLTSAYAFDEVFDKKSFGIRMMQVEKLTQKLNYEGIDLKIHLNNTIGWMYSYFDSGLPSVDSNEEEMRKWTLLQKVINECERDKIENFWKPRYQK
jgi:hypothetical protein